jgi:hypothetical protein
MNTSILSSINNLFTPLSIPNLQFWYDYTDLSTITKDESDFVSQVLDKSGNSFTTIQGTGSAQPKYIANGFGTNNKPHLLFDGSDFVQYTGSLNNNQGSLYVVCEYSSLRSVLFGKGSNTRWTFLEFFTGDVLRFNWRDNGTADDLRTSTTSTINTPYLISVYSDASTTTLKRNSNLLSLSAISGENKGSWFNNAQGNFYIGRQITSGGESFMNGKISEVICFTRKLTDNEDAKVLQYLNTKYGIY